MDRTYYSVCLNIRLNDLASVNFFVFDKFLHILCLIGVKIGKERVTVCSGWMSNVDDLLPNVQLYSKSSKGNM